MDTSVPSGLSSPLKVGVLRIVGEYLLRTLDYIIMGSREGSNPLYYDSIHKVSKRVSKRYSNSRSTSITTDGRILWEKPLSLDFV